jgi:hypothetical protein
MMADHVAWFKKYFKRDPTPAEAYLMHLQGRGFFTKGIMTNIRGNPYPGMKGPQTPQSFLQGWANELQRRMNRFGGGTGTATTGDPNAKTGNPTVSGDPNFPSDSKGATPSPIVWSNLDEIERLEREAREQTSLPAGGFTPIPRQGGSNKINLKVNVRGRNARVSSESSGDLGSATVSRDRLDPSGGIEGFSPG